MQSANLLGKIKIHKKLLYLIGTLVLVTIFYFLYFFLLRPTQIINDTYKNPTNTKLINLNEQVAKSLKYEDFKKDLKIKILKRNLKEITILATYPAPNYLDSKNAIVADVFKLKNKWIKWEVTEVKSTYTDIPNNDLTKARENIEKLLIENGAKGIDEAEEKEIIDRNQKLIDQYGLSKNSKIASDDGKKSFAYESTPTGKKLRIEGAEKQPQLLNAIYADWHDDNKTLIFVDYTLDGTNDAYKIVSFNTESGEQKTLFTKQGMTGLLGFISKKDFVAYTSNTEIGIVNIKTGEAKSLHQFPKVGLNSDETYIPDLQQYDDTYFLGEVFDKDYLNNKKVEIWKFAWDGSYAQKQDEYIDKQ